MHYLLVVLGVVFFVFMAPGKVVASTLLTAAVVSAVVRFTAQSITRSPVTYVESLKAVGLSLLFLGLALVALAQLSFQTQVYDYDGLSGWAVFIGLFSAYVLGFKVGLGTTFTSSAMIALVSTVMSSTALWLVRSVA
jgi:hypothetical protein